MARDYGEHLVAEIKQHGVQDWTVETGGKHKRLKFVWNERKITFIFANSPSDQRGMMNALGDLRRCMGVRKLKPGKARRQVVAH